MDADLSGFSQIDCLCVSNRCRVSGVNLTVKSFPVNFKRVGNSDNFPVLMEKFGVSKCKRRTNRQNNSGWKWANMDDEILQA